MGVVKALSHPDRPVLRLLELANSWSTGSPIEVAATEVTCKTARQLKPAEIDKLVDTYQAGATVFQLAEQFGINRITVGRHLKTRGIDTRLPAITEDELEQVISHYRDGRSITTIAKQYGVSNNAVRDRLIAAGVKMRPRGWPGTPVVDRDLHGSVCDCRW
ncbi:helix-turn-helix domain-containing protein [Actinophytocola oryzae]|uniref:helix-turn-helix domain-containing protein n=1 Tax=Actinophytocola oryzae TaxID=502181 RepID=UPI001063C484|nr:hypothetical protein [Actinophytocola oryzae]